MGDIRVKLKKKCVVRGRRYKPGDVISLHAGAAHAFVSSKRAEYLAQQSGLGDVLAVQKDRVERPKEVVSGNHKVARGEETDEEHICPHCGKVYESEYWFQKHLVKKHGAE